MNIDETIRERRSIGLVKQDEVSETVIKKLLEAAVCAPNHHRTEPWRFYVMTGAGRDVLGQAYASIASGKMPDPSTEENQIALKKHYEKAFRAPVVIAVAAAPSDSPKVERREELAAVHAAIQNLLLTAHSLGLGAIWRTGEPTYQPQMKRAFGLRESDEMTGFIYIGYPVRYPNESATQYVPPSFEEKVEWLK